MGKGDDLHTNAIDEWLDVSHDDGSGSMVGESPLLQEPGLATALYNLSSRQLSRLAAVWPASRMSPADKRRKARLSSLRSRFAVFGDSFEHGKLESCLNADDELRTSIITLLHDVGNVLLSDVVTTLVDRGGIPDLIGDSDDSSDTNIAGKPRRGSSYAPSSLLRDSDFELRPPQAESATRLEADATVTTILRQLVTQASTILDESDTDSEASSATETEDAPSTNRSEHSMDTHCLRPLAAYIDLLMDLCPTLEHTFKDMHKTNSRRAPRSARGTISVTPAAGPYVRNVQDKFPRANQELVRRLGEANWQRHERLRAIQASGPASESKAIKDSKSLFRPVSLFQDSALGSSIRTQSQRAESNASHSSFVSSSADNEKSRFQVPGLPKGASYGEPFICPYCCEMVFKVNNRIDWKMHVFTDLNAYICTSGGCSLTTFPSRRLWFDHESAFHLTTSSLHCKLCLATFDDADKFLHHSKSIHMMALDTSNLKLAALHVAKGSQTIPPESMTCPLCLHTGWSKLRDYSIHLGRHLEEIALCALPPPNGYEEEVEDHDSDATSGFVTINFPPTIEPLPSGQPEVSWKFPDNQLEQGPGTSSLAGERKVESPATPNLVPSIPDDEMNGKAIALFDFEVEHENELPLEEGQVITVLSRHGRGWLIADDPRTGNAGLIPEEYVRLIKHIPGGLEGLHSTVLDGEGNASHVVNAVSKEAAPSITTVPKDHNFPPPEHASKLRSGDEDPELPKPSGQFFPPVIRTRDAKLSERYPMKCICGYLAGEDLMVVCHRCETRQHVKCYYREAFAMPATIHECVDCSRSNLDVPLSPRAMSAKALAKRRELVDKETRELAKRRELVDKETGELVKLREAIDKERGKMAMYREAIDKERRKVAMEREAFDKETEEIAKCREVIDKQKGESASNRIDHSRYMSDPGQGSVPESVLGQDFLASDPFPSLRPYQNLTTTRPNGRLNVDAVDTESAET